MKIGSKKGFTLIELLIVIAIIGILAVALLPTILGAPAKGRDAARKANMDQIVTGIEGWNLDKGLGYPLTTGASGNGGCLNNGNAAFNQPAGGALAYVQGGAFPKDPLAGNGAIIVTSTGNCARGEYVYGSIDPGTYPGKNYFLAAYMEVLADANTTVLPPVDGKTAPTLTAPVPTVPCKTMDSGGVIVGGACLFVVVK